MQFQCDPLLRPELWSRLPLEIKREIIIHLALSSLKIARELRLISNDFNVLVLPLLFRDLVLSTPHHVSRFVTTILPKRRNSMPALKSKLHLIPRPLCTYNIDSLALGIDCRRPSIENALASIAPAFCGLTKLATSGQNLSSHAYWLRQHAIHPQKMIIFHYGSPHLVNFNEPIFQSVTHLLTSITHGHRYSSVSDLPELTHLAVHTRINLPDNTQRKIATALKELLIFSTRLKSLVLSLDCVDLSDNRLERWYISLDPCLKDPRFVILPHRLSPRMEWLRMIEGKPTIWDQALAWCNFGSSEIGSLQKLMQFKEQQQETEDFLAAENWKNEWEIDLVERDNYSAVEHEGSVEYGGERQYNALG